MSGHLRVHDTRTAQDYTIPVSDDSVQGSDLTQIKGPKNATSNDTDSAVIAAGNGLKVLDPGYQNTAIMKSSIAFA